MNFMKITISLMLVLASITLYAQGPDYYKKENNIWCFGVRMKLDFASGMPLVDSCEMTAVEGGSAVSDKNGQLLFYTNGNDVWDRGNGIMINGTGLLGNGPAATFGGGTLAGSSQQGVIIMPAPTDANKYYIFVLEAGEQLNSWTTNGKLRYNIVDMSLSGGMGAVTVKNIVLDTNTMEKMTMAKGNGCYNWLIVHDYKNAQFRAYKVDASGVSATPVISNVGGFDKQIQLGDMKMSPNGLWLGNLTRKWSDTTYGAVEIHPFNATTGIVAPPIFTDTLKANRPYYGLTFSPNSSKLYITSFLNGIYQYDLSLLPNQQSVRNSMHTHTGDFWGMRLAPDNKIYVSHLTTIYQINNPDVQGPGCNITISSLTPIGNTRPYATFGETIQVNRVDTFRHSIDTMICLNPSGTLKARNNFTSYYWDNATTSQTRAINAPGKYWVLATNGCEVFIDTFNVSISHTDTVKYAHDSTHCFTSGPYIAASPPGYISYQWNDGSTMRTRSFTTPGTRWVTAKNDCNGMRVDTFRISIRAIDTTTMVTDSIHCFKAITPLILNAPPGYTSYQWNTGSTLPNITFTGAGTNWVYAKSGCNVLIDTLIVKAKSYDTTTTHTDTALCFEFSSPIILHADAGHTSYLWNDATTQPLNVFTGPAVKWVYMSTGCNMLIDTFKVTAKHIDTTTQLTDTALCFAQSPAIFLSAVPGYNAYRWSNGGTSPSTAFTGPATYWVYAQRGCNMLVDTFEVTAKLLDTTTARQDTAHCFILAPTLALTAPNGYNTYLWRHGANTQTASFGTTGTTWVYAQKGCDLLIDSFYISNKINDTTIYRHDTTVCFNAYPSITVQAPQGYSSYIWNNGAPGPGNTFTTAGTKWVYSLYGCEVRIDTFHMRVQVQDTMRIVTDTTICFQNTVALSLPDGFSTYLWSDGTTTPVYTGQQGGTVWGMANDGCQSLMHTYNISMVNFGINLGNDTSICSNDTLLLDATVPMAGYMWQNGTKQATFTVKSAGVYVATVTLQGCTLADTIKVEGWDIDVNFGDYASLCNGDELELKTNIENATYLWQDGSTKDSYTVQAPGLYWVQVQKESCHTADSLVVEYEQCDCMVVMPNAFTPNGDGLNDKIGVYMDCVPTDYVLRIFNRWGQEVFTGTDITAKWDGNFKGKPAELSTYYFALSYKTPRGDKMFRKGEIMLLR